MSPTLTHSSIGAGMATVACVVFTSVSTSSDPQVTQYYPTASPGEMFGVPAQKGSRDHTGPVKLVDGISASTTGSGIHLEVTAKADLFDILSSTVFEPEEVGKMMGRRSKAQPEPFIDFDPFE